MPTGAPPRQMATRKVGLKPLRTIRRARAIESRSSDSLETKTFSRAGEALGGFMGGLLRERARIVTHRTILRAEAHPPHAHAEKHRDQSPNQRRGSAAAEGEAHRGSGTVGHPAGRHLFRLCPQPAEAAHRLRANRRANLLPTRQSELSHAILLPALTHLASPVSAELPHSRVGCRRPRTEAPQ